MPIALLTTTLVAFSISLSLLSKQTKGLFVILVSLRLKVTLAIHIALRPLKKILTIIATLR